MYLLIVFIIVKYYKINTKKRYMHRIFQIITLLIISLCTTYSFAATHTKSTLQSGFYIKNHLDIDLEQEFCQKSNLNKRKTLDYWSQKTGFAPQKIAIPHNNFPEGEHRLFFDPKENISTEAAYKLGVFYGTNICQSADIQKAKYYLKKAGAKAEARFVYAMLLLREKNKLSEIYKLFLEAGALGIGEAYYNAAILLYKKDTEKYMRKIIFLLKKAKDNGYARAANDLGVLMLSHQGTTLLLKPEEHYNKNIIDRYISHATDHIKSAADQNDKYGLYNLAALLSAGTCEHSHQVKTLLEKAISYNAPHATKSYHALVKKKCFKAKQDKKTLSQIASLLIEHEKNTLSNKSKFGIRFTPK